jgi:hypothetical protein
MYFTQKRPRCQDIFARLLVETGWRLVRWRQAFCIAEHLLPVRAQNASAVRIGERSRFC